MLYGLTSFTYYQLLTLKTSTNVHLNFRRFVFDSGAMEHHIVIFLNIKSQFV